MRPLTYEHEANPPAGESETPHGDHGADESVGYRLRGGAPGGRLCRWQRHTREAAERTAERRRYETEHSLGQLHGAPDKLGSALGEIRDTFGSSDATTWRS